MRRALIVLVVLLVAGAAFFFASFDLDRYRPQLERRASESVGSPVRAGRLKVVWGWGIRVVAEGLTVLDRETGEPVAGLDRAEAVLRVGPLLGRRIEIASVRLVRPRATVVTGPGGTRVLGIEPRKPAAKPAAAAPRESGEEPPRLAIDSVHVRDGELTIAREGSPGETYEVSRIDADAYDIAPGQRMRIDASAALLSEAPNARLSARILLPENPGRAVEDVRADLTVSELALPQLPEPVRDLSVQAVWNGETLRIPRFSAGVAGGSVSGTASVRPQPAPAAAEFRLEARDLEAGRLAPSAGGIAPEGRVSGEFQGTAAGLSGPEAFSTLEGAGVLTLRDGAVTGFNLLREVLDRISVLPGLARRLEDNLPAGYRERLLADRTEIGPVDLPFEVRGPSIFFPDASFGSSGFSVRAKGRYGFADRSVEASGLLRMDSALSQAMEAAVPETGALRGAEGFIDVPFTARGTGGRVLVLPDVRDLAARAAVSKASEIAEEALLEAVGGERQDSAAGEAVEPAAAPETGAAGSPREGAVPPAGASSEPEKPAYQRILELLS